MIKAFVVGTGRSGTTLLANLLGSHSALSPLYEPEFLLNLLQGAHRQGKIVPQEFLGALYHWGSMWGGLPFKGLWARDYDPIRPRFGSKYILFNKVELMAAATLFLEDIEVGPFEPALHRFVETLAEFHSRRSEKPHCIIKLPGLLQTAEDVLAAFPAARLVHIYRDGRDVWCSVKPLWWGPQTVHDAARWWVRHMEVAEAIERRLPDRIIQVRYESLLESPETQLDRIFTLLGVPPEPIDLSIVPGAVGRFRREMSEEDLALFEAEAGDVLERKGYLVRV